MKCCSTEDVCMYFWLKTKMQGKHLPGNMLQSYLFLVTELSFAKHFSPLHSFSLLGWFVDDDLYCIQPVVLSSGFHNLSRKFKSLKQPSFCKFIIKPFGMMCHWMLTWQYARVAGLYPTPSFFFYEHFTQEKSTYFTSLYLFFIWPKFAQGLLVIFCCMLCIFRIFGQQ